LCLIRVDIISLGANPQASINNPNTQETTAPRFSTAPSTMVGPFQSMGLNGPQSGYYGDGFYNFQGKRIPCSKNSIKDISIIKNGFEAIDVCFKLIKSEISVGDV